jgi:hypothetical protein
VALCAPQIPQRMGWDPRRIFVHQKEEVTPGRIKLRKEELRNLLKPDYILITNFDALIIIYS